MMNDRILHHYLDEFRAGTGVDPAEAETLFDAIITGENQFLLSELLSAWNEKGITEDELFEFASIMRNRMTRINSRHATFVDIVGTGGSRAKTFNISTAAAFVAAGAGVPVAKHGNRAATSKSGSADVLSLLGIDFDVEPEIAQISLNDHGLCFMFAPRFHSLSTTLANARRSLKTPTIFNNLGPLCNPASTPHQLIGVSDIDLIEKTAKVLARLGSARSWVVHGENGLDEIALTGKTHIAEINGDVITRFTITSEDFGVNSISGDLPSNCTADESARLINDILHNKMSGSGAEKLVLMSAAAAIYITGHASDLKSAYPIAKNSIQNGAAKAKLKDLADTTMK